MFGPYVSSDCSHILRYLRIHINFLADHSWSRSPADHGLSSCQGVNTARMKKPEVWCAFQMEGWHAYAVCPEHSAHLF